MYLLWFQYSYCHIRNWPDKEYEIRCYELCARCAIFFSSVVFIFKGFRQLIKTQQNGFSLMDSILFVLILNVCLCCFVDFLNESIFCMFTGWCSIKKLGRFIAPVLRLITTWFNSLVRNFHNRCAASYRVYCIWAEKICGKNLCDFFCSFPSIFRLFFRKCTSETRNRRNKKQKKTRIIKMLPGGEASFANCCAHKF